MVPDFQHQSRDCRFPTSSTPSLVYRVSYSHRGADYIVNHTESGGFFIHTSVRGIGCATFIGPTVCEGIFFHLGGVLSVI